MDHANSSESYQLRPASQADAKAIRDIIHLVGINPLALDWRRFTLAIDPNGKIIGCGQIKSHGDGSQELASIAVLPEWRGQGVARRIIEHLLKQQPGRLYLTCQSTLEPLYRKFGFGAIETWEMPHYFRRLSRIVNGINKLVRSNGKMLVMRKN
jgi:amino-acid N-acetyltransferase